MNDGMRPASVEDAQQGYAERGTATQTSSGLGISATGPSARSSRLWVIGAVISLLGVVSLVGVGLLGYPIIAGLFRQSAVRASGVLAPARILRVRTTDARVNEERVIELRVQVVPTEGKPYQASVAQPFSMLHGANLVVGGGVSVKYDPDDPESVVVVATGTPPPTEPESSPTDAMQEDVPPLQQSPRKDTIEKEGAHEAVELDVPKNADPTCVTTARCCLTVSGPAALSSCQNFVTGQVPPEVCATALGAYQKAAEALDQSCPE